jgi:hypothetical protein
MQKLPNGMVTLPEAARMACFGAGICGAISDVHLNAMAQELARLLTLYVVCEAGAPDGRALTADELQGAVFSGRAAEITYPDGRPPIRGLAVTATALFAVLKVLRPVRTSAA